MGVTFRPAGPADAEAIARIHVVGWQQGYAELLPADYLAGLQERQRADYWAGEIRSPTLPGSTVLVAERDEHVVGFAGAGPARDEDLAAGTGPAARSWELYALYVDPACWRTGAGWALLNEVDSLARGAGADELVLWVLRDNARGRAFYDAAGFTADGAEEPYECGGVRLLEVRLRRGVRTGVRTGSG